jgi:glycosyltransferase involved in cell wall biosynthesis
MNTTPLVSIIIPFYNTPEKFMKEAIESVFAQGYHNWEILIVDDGSIGKCIEIAKYYANTHPEKVRYLKHPNHQNKGASATRNLGIKYAEGEYVTFLDSDDVWLPKKLEQQLAIMTLRPEVGMVYGKALYWWSWTNNPEDRVRDHIQEHGIFPDVIIDPPILLKFFIKEKTAIPPTSSVMVRRKVIESIGGFEERFRGDNENPYDDQAFYAKVCLEFPVFVSNSCWERYRQHPDSLCAVATSEKVQRAHLTYLEWLEENLSERGFKGSNVWRTLRSQKWFRRHRSIGRPIKRIQRFIWRRQGTYPLCVKK